MDRAPRSALFALGRGRNVHFRAVLGDGAAADLDAESRERQTKRLVRERRSRVLCANAALQPLLDREGRDCRVGADRRGEKAAHGDDPALELNLFILRRTAHGGGADAHFFGKLLHRHGQQCLAATEKAVLLAPDEREHLYECVAAGVDALADGLGNIHGIYPAYCMGVCFESLPAVQELTGELPLVLHGGTGIPADQIKKAIDLGVSKINVNTECQLAFADATRKYIEAGKDLEGKGFDPRKLLAPGAEAIKATVKEKMELFGSVGKAE